MLTTTYLGWPLDRWKDLIILRCPSRWVCPRLAVALSLLPSLVDRVLRLTLVSSPRTHLVFTLVVKLLLHPLCTLVQLPLDNIRPPRRGALLGLIIIHLVKHSIRLSRWGSTLNTRFTWEGTFPKH